jgi:hypothetical protein
MKTLAEKSIKITGVPKTNAKTLFDLNKIPALAEDATEEQKKEVKEKESENKKITSDRGFTSLTIISGRKLVVQFEFEEEGVKTKDKVLISIPKTDSEEEIKEFIINAINSQKDK